MRTLVVTMFGMIFAGGGITSLKQSFFVAQRRAEKYLRSEENFYQVRKLLPFIITKGDNDYENSV
jgi:hypothetical protein